MKKVKKIYKNYYRIKSKKSYTLKKKKKIIVNVWLSILNFVKFKQLIIKVKFYIIITI